MTTLPLHTIATGLAITLAGAAPASAQADLCALLTEAEAEAILGKPLPRFK